MSKICLLLSTLAVCAACLDSAPVPGGIPTDDPGDGAVDVGPGTLSGTVVDYYGSFGDEPTPLANVSLSTRGLALPISLESDIDGRFQLNAPVGQVFRLEAETPDDSIRPTIGPRWRGEQAPQMNELVRVFTEDGIVAQSAGLAVTQEATSGFVAIEFLGPAGEAVPGIAAADIELVAITGPAPTLVGPFFMDATATLSITQLSSTQAGPAGRRVAHAALFNVPQGEYSLRVTYPAAFGAETYSDAVTVLAGGATLVQVNRFGGAP